MKITTTLYKDVPAILLENGRYSLTLLPGEGAKAVSFKTLPDGREYFWQNPSPSYGHIGLSDSYVDGECSSFDDMFPTVDPTVFKSGSRAGLEYPDHGEVCRVPFSCRITEHGVLMEMTSAALGYTYRKSVTENARGEFTVHYEIINNADDAFSALWAGHCMLSVSDGGRVLAPLSDGEEVEIMFDDRGEFGARGMRLPINEDMRTSHTSPERRNSFKYYYSAPAEEGKLGYRYPDGRTFWLCYDRDALPYVGIWVNNGSFKDSFCVGLEPCNLGYDTVYNAMERGQSFVIPPEGSLSFDLTFSVEGCDE